MNKKNIPIYLRYLGVAFVSAPIVVWWTEFTLITPAPFYYYYQQVTTYFIDSMAVFTGNTYGFIDHPGTPVSILGSIFLALTYPFIDNRDFILYHLSHPWIFHHISTTFIALLFILSAVYFYKTGLVIFERLSWLPSVSLPLMYFFLNTKSINSITLWEHNAFAFPLGTSLLVFLVSMIYKGQALENRRVSWLGFFIGILTAVQFYFITWVATAFLIILLFNQFKKENFGITLKTEWSLFIAFMAGFTVSILPVIKKMPAFFRWIEEIIISDQRYTQGAHVFITWPIFVSNFQLLIHSQRLLFMIAPILVTLFLFLLYRFKRDKNANAGLLAMGTGLVFQVICLTFMFTVESGPFYTLSIAATLPVLTLVILKLLEYEFIIAHKSGVGWVYASILIGLFLFSGARTTLNVIRTDRGYRKMIAAQNNINDRVGQFIAEYARASGKKEQDLVIVNTPNVFNACAALLFGRTYAHLNIDAQLSQLCPNQYYMDSWQKAVVVDDKPHYLNEINWDLLLVGKQYLNLELVNLTKRDVLHEISRGYFVVENKK